MSYKTQKQLSKKLYAARKELRQKEKVANIAHRYKRPSFTPMVVKPSPMFISDEMQRIHDLPSVGTC